MTDAPAPPPHEPTPLEMSKAAVTVAALGYLMAAREDDPHETPLNAITRLIDAVAMTTLTLVPAPILSTALLVVFEALHPNPMDFIQREKAKQALEQIANERRDQLAAKAKIVDIHGNAMRGTQT